MLQTISSCCEINPTFILWRLIVFWRNHFSEENHFSVQHLCCWCIEGNYLCNINIYFIFFTLKDNVTIKQVFLIIQVIHIWSFKLNSTKLVMRKHFFQETFLFPETWCICIKIYAPYFCHMGYKLRISSRRKKYKPKKVVWYKTEFLIRITLLDNIFW